MKKIFNASRLHWNTKGFTIIEVLVTMSVIVVIGTIIGGILVTTLRGSTKATVVSNVKQNGDNAITEMSREIRSAAAINLMPCGNPSPVVQKITVTQIDNTQTTFDCSGNTIKANGTSLLDTSTTQLTSCSIICSQKSSADVPIVQIQFNLQQSNSGAAEEQTATVPFQTSVVLRNIQQ